MDKQTIEFIVKMLENLPKMNSEVMQGWIDDPKGFQEALRQSLCRFKTFMTIKLGTGLKTADDFRQAIADEGGCISDWASDILGQLAFTVATEETEVKLVAPTVAALGFKDGAKYSDICEQAKQFGLALCPSEVGPQLRRQYKDQPKDEWLRIAIEPITDSDGLLKVFYVGHNSGGLWLSAGCGRPDFFWHSGHRWVFVSRK